MLGVSFSEIVKHDKKEDREGNASNGGLVLGKQVDNRDGKKNKVIRPSPNGISTPKMWKFNGT